VERDNPEATAQNNGLLVIALLALLTLVEFLVFAAIDMTSAVILMLAPIALAKAWLIVTFFMHMPRLWNSEDHS